MRDEKKQQKEALKEEMLRLGNLQRECKEEKIPVYITFDGYDGAGKGVQIGRLMQALDPRGFEVYMKRKQMPRLRISARLRDAWWTAEPFSSNFFWIFPRRNRKNGLKNFWNQRIPRGASQRKNLREMPITENIRSSAMR